MTKFGETPCEKDRATPSSPHGATDAVPRPSYMSGVAYRSMTSLPTAPRWSCSGKAGVPLPRKTQPNGDVHRGKKLHMGPREKLTGRACYRAKKHLKKQEPLLHHHITRNHNQKRFFAKQLVPRVTAHEFVEDARSGPMLALWGQKFPPWVVSHPPDPAQVGLGGPESLPSIVSVRH